MSSKRTYQRCTNCIMDTSDPWIEFDEKGICNHCISYFTESKKILQRGVQAESALSAIYQKIKDDGKNKPYDCLVGLSGGVDSSYVAYLVRSKGLRPLGVHVDGGWNLELATENIERLVKKLNIDLVTYVVNWEEMRDLQLAFFKASVPNIDIPQDHAFVAAIFKTAQKYKIRYLMSGYNYQTENVFPKAWEHRFKDLAHLKDIHKKYGTIPLKQYPTFNFFQFNYYYPYINRIRDIRQLNYIDYKKDEAISLLKNQFGWRDYGAKHHESRFTRFYEAYFLPRKFGWDKRITHYSSLILSGQMTRDEALKKMDEPWYSEDILQDDYKYMCNKLRISKEEFEEILNRSPREHSDFKTNDSLLSFKLKLHSYFGL